MLQGVVKSGAEDVKVLREDIARLELTVEKLAEAVTDLRVLVAGNYVPKADFNECKKCAEDRVVKIYERIEEHEKNEKEDRWKMAGLVFTISAFVFGIIQWIVSLFRSQGGGQ